jgi:hypothetical protein
VVGAAKLVTPGEIIAARLSRSREQRRRDALHEARKGAAREECRAIVHAWLERHGYPLGQG